jgi:hypothetical protein
MLILIMGVVALAAVGAGLVVVGLIVYSLKRSGLVTSPRLTYAGSMALSLLLAAAYLAWQGHVYGELAPTSGAPNENSYMSMAAWFAAVPCVLCGVMFLMAHAGVRFSRIARGRRKEEEHGNREPLGVCPMCAEDLEGVPDQCPHCGERLDYGGCAPSGE